MAKKKKDTMTGITMGGITGLGVTGAIPSSLAPGAAGIKTSYATGVSNVGRALPVMGKIKGTTMVLKSLKKLKPIKFKGGRKL